MAAAANEKSSAVANQIPMPEICWNRQKYCVPEPQVTSFDQFIQNIHNKVNFAASQAMGTEEEKKMLDQLEAIIFKWATKQYRDGVQWNPVTF